MSTDPPTRPGFFQRLTSRTKAPEVSTEGIQAGPSGTVTGTLKSAVAEVQHGAGSVAEASKHPGKDDDTIKPPDLLDGPAYTSASPSRWYLHARAFTIRNLAAIGFGLQHRSDPPAVMPSSTIWIDSTLSQWNGTKKISLDTWTPLSSTEVEGGRTCVISFHGGGFILGTGTDDARWAMACMNHLDAVVVAVNYRMAPGYPFPTPVEDCADAILHVAKHAKTFGIDPNKIFLSGFSAGGNLAFAAYHLLHTPSTWSYPTFTPPKIRGIVAYYPLLDFSISRKAKKERSHRPDFCMPDSLTGLFDDSYLHPPPDRTDARLSPGRAPDEMIARLPPVHLCCCEYDMLLQEAEQFRDRLQSLNKPVNFRMVREEKHGWDKPPPMNPKESVLEEYLKAIESIKGWLGDEGEASMTTKGAEGETVDKVEMQDVAHQVEAGRGKGLKHKVLGQIDKLDLE